MKILLLGSSGQLGSDIIRMNHARHSPLTITALNRKNLDVTDKTKVRDTLLQHSFDVLINCTSYHNTDQVEANPIIAFDVNAYAIKHLAEICKEKHARFIQISTDYVFSHHHQPLSESDLPSPLNIYGASKLMGEALAQAVYDDVIIFRVASLFGLRGASGKGGNFVETIIKNAKAKGQLRVISDQIMSPTSTADIAAIILKSIQLNLPAGIYHAVNSGYASWYEYAKTIIDYCQIKATVDPIPAKDYPAVAMRPTYSALNNSKLSGYIGAIPHWQNALKRYLIEKEHIKQLDMSDA